MSYVYSFNLRDPAVEFEKFEKQTDFRSEITKLEAERIQLLERVTVSFQNIEKRYKCECGTVQVQVLEYSEEDKKRDFEKYKDIGHEAYSRKEYEKAINAFNKALDFNPQDTNLIFYRMKAKLDLMDSGNQQEPIDLTGVESILDSI
ncbi:MAG TPA: tetratricopeptide repeat protein [Rhabdochlamydiaceae bacterium]|nr:tetratricopeptide repeat protein [Rhabdochlamydiaceae bacterium]